MVQKRNKKFAALQTVCRYRSRLPDRAKRQHQHDAAERMLYLAAIALHEAFGFGCGRLKRFLLKTVELSTEYNAIREADGKEYAARQNRCFRKKSRPCTAATERQGAVYENRLSDVSVSKRVRQV